jgi:hypothetical protein
MRNNMKKNKRFRLLLIFSGIFFLMACGLFETPPPTRVNTPIPTMTQEPPPTDLPVIDVAIVDIVFPPSVQSNQEFEYTIKVKNIAGTSLAGVTEIDIRARSFDGGTDIPFLGTVVRDLEPNQTKEVTITQIAPNSTGIWTVYATVIPVNYVDNVNNTYDKGLNVN